MPSNQKTPTNCTTNALNPTDTYWCVTHIDLDRNQGDAITFGTTNRDVRLVMHSEDDQIVPTPMLGRCPPSSC